MLALDPFVKRSSASDPPPPPITAAATTSFLPSASAVAVAASAASTPPSASAARHGRLHLQPHQPPFENAASVPRKDGDADADGSSSSDSEAQCSERSRRRFVKPVTTSYEHCFSRSAVTKTGTGRRFARRAGAQPRVGLASYSFINSNSTASIALAAAAEAAQANASPLAPITITGARKSAPPAVSSLSSALQELMHGRHRALSSYVDATAPQTNARTFVVKQDSDGSFYVASSTGEKFAADSAIGKVFLEPAPVRKSSNAAMVGPPLLEATPMSPPAAAGTMRRSDLDFGARGHRRSPVAALRRSLSRQDGVEGEDGGNRRSSAFGASKAKLGLSSLKSKLTARRNSFVRRNSFGRGSDRPLTLDDMAVPDDDLSFHVLDDDNALPMLDPDLVDARARGDSSWEVLAVPTLSFGTGATTAGEPPRPTVDRSQIVNRPIPYASSKLSTTKDDDDDDDDDNLLNRSFLNVRDIEFNPRKDKDGAPPAHADACDNDDDDQCVGSAANTRDENCSASDNAPCEVRTTGTRGSSLSAAPGTRVSASNVSEFLGGFKGQLSLRRTSMGQDANSGYVNRARSVRNSARKSAAANAANTAASALTRKLGEARSRIPPEFQNDAVAPARAKKRRNGKKLRVRWDLTLYCREFEVESENEDDAAAANIVKAPWEYRDSEEHESDDDDDDDSDGDTRS